ncbi:hypothetical protein [Rhodococcus erythropolis]|uniref:hypothetical protein n=1 Tax=Rhodococcus erythropolis TaxID=1833 RepID=UPI001F477376|nr:hypothetical protein [Rhodococcus erythropolis]
MTDDQKFAMIPHPVLDLLQIQQDSGKRGIDFKTLALYSVLVRHRDYGTGETFIGRTAMAKELGYNRPSEVDRPLAKLMEAGLIERQHRWHDGGTLGNRTYSFERTDTHHCQGSSIYRILHFTDARAGGDANRVPGGDANRVPGGDANRVPISRTTLVENPVERRLGPNRRSGTIRLPEDLDTTDEHALNDYAQEFLNDGLDHTHTIRNFLSTKAYVGNPSKAFQVFLSTERQKARHLVAV